MPRLSWLRPASLSGLAPKYALWITALVAALLVLSGALNLQFAWRENLAHIDALQAEKARGAATRIELFITDIERQIGWTLLPSAPATRSDAVPAGVPPAAALRRIELLKLLRQARAITDVAWIDVDGLEQVRVSRLALNQLGHGLPRHDDPAFKETAQGRTWRSSITFRQDSEPYLRVARRASAGGGVTVADINLKFVWDVVASPVLGAGSVAYVVTDEGTLVAHPDISLVLKKTDMRALPQVQAALANAPEGAGRHTADAVDTVGRPVLAAAARIDTLGWTVLVESPRSQALAPVLQSAWRLVAVVAAGLVLSVLASVLLARSLTRPIQVLQMGADRIGAGDLEHRIAVTTHDEVQALAERFNQMAGNLQASVGQLEQRVAERTGELAEANEAKSRFIAAASHDLRQPVHALGLFVGQLRDSSDPAARQALLAHIESSVAAFEALLESLLDISRLDAGAVPVRPQALALAPLLERLLQGQAAAAQRKGLRLALHVARPHGTAAGDAAAPGLTVLSDPVLLERVITNLLGNAVRYTAQGGVLVAARQRGAAVQVAVIDTGIGIAEDQLNLVFREFYRAPGPAAGEDPGLGLGLAIVRRLTDLLGHTLELRSRPGRGTWFTLTLPLAAAAAAPQAPAIAAPTSPIAAPAVAVRGRRVLVIDDDAAVREAMRGQLASWGLQVMLAADAAQAWQAFDDVAGGPDAVLCDLRLGAGLEGTDGLALALEIQARHRLPLAIVSGETSADRVQAVRDAGLPLLTKPLRPARLRAQLEAMLGPAQTVVSASDGRS